MNDPSLALWLYLAVIIVSVLFSPKWGEFVKAVQAAKGVTPATTEGSSNTEGGNHTL